jgi:hypothetical protein
MSQQQTMGALAITRREGEKVFLALDGRSLGYIDISRISGEKVVLAFVLDKAVKIRRDFDQGACIYCGAVESLDPKGSCTHCNRERMD